MRFKFTKRRKQAIEISHPQPNQVYFIDGAYYILTDIAQSSDGSLTLGFEQKDLWEDSHRLVWS